MKLTTTQAKLRATTATLSQEKDMNTNKSNEIKQLQSKLDLLTIEKNKLWNALKEEVNNKPQQNDATTLTQQNDYGVDDGYVDNDDDVDDVGREVMGVIDESYVDMGDMSKLSMTAIYSGHDEAEFQSGSEIYTER
jgi:hypothetical protein